MNRAGPSLLGVTAKLFSGSYAVNGSNSAVSSYAVNSSNFLNNGLFYNGLGSFLSSLVRRTAGEQRCAESNSGN